MLHISLLNKGLKPLVFKYLIFAFLLILFVFPVAAQDSALQVDATKDLGKISPYIYGANGLQSTLSPDLFPVAKALNLKVLRMGGDPSDQQDVNESALDLFVLQARIIGAEPLITVRLLDGTPEKAATIVHYANIEKDYKIRYWSIGNEPNFYVAVQHVPSYTTQDLIKNWRAIAVAMLAVDPNIVLVGPDISQYVVLDYQPGKIQYLEDKAGGDATDNLGKDWMQEFLKANGDLIGIVSIHRYPYPGGSKVAPATISGLREDSQQWDVMIPNLRQLIKDVTGRDRPIAVTEFNSNSNNNIGGEAGLDTLYNAIWVADVLGRLIRQQVYMSAYWDLRRKDAGFGLIGAENPRPTYYAYLMYTHLGTELLASESSDAALSITAAKNDDGSLTLMVINLSSDQKKAALEIKGFTSSSPADVWLFDKDHQAENIGTQDLSAGMATLPPESVTLYIVPASK
jgi:hypothetical protein